MTESEETLVEAGDDEDEPDPDEEPESDEPDLEPPEKPTGPEVGAVVTELDEKRLIEAALFISGRELSLEELRRLTGVGALGYLQGLVEQLQKEYAERGSSLEIVQMDGKYSMRVRNEYLTPVRQFAQDTEISKNALRTLAYVAKHDGMLKSELAKRIGSQIYQDVQELVSEGFVKPQKAGRSSKLFLTEKFKKYFSQQ